MILGELETTILTNAPGFVGMFLMYLLAKNEISENSKAITKLSLSLQELSNTMMKIMQRLR